MTTISDWNVVVSTQEGAYKQAKVLLKELGMVARTPYYNVFVMWVVDVRETLEELRSRCETNPKILEWLGHFVPATIMFNFSTPEEFEAKAKDAVCELLPQLAGKTFHVRVHRRGFRDRIIERDEERLLGEAILKRLEEAGTPARVTFDDPDAIVVIETVSQRAGLSLWTREERKRYSFLRLTS